MLVLKRKIGEGLTILTPNGEHCRIVLVETGRGFARIGFEFPQDYQINRDDMVKPKPEAEDDQRDG